MARLILSRLLQLPIILAVIFVVTFALLLLTPGNPFDRNPEKPLAPEVLAAMEARYGFNNPLTFLGKYVTNVVTKFDFGPSLQYRGKQVTDIILEGLPVSAGLGVFALVVALVLGLSAGIIGALKPGSIWDMSSLVIALIGVSLPSFVTASILLTVFAGLLLWFPSNGWGTPMHVVLPAIALGAAPAAYIARLTRLGLADVMSSDFIRTARAKGLSNRAALMRHAIKVAFLPVLSFLGPAAAATMTGSFVIEHVFALPGLGNHFVNSVLNNDRFLTLGLVLVYSTMLVVFNLIVDVAYAWVDPRIEL